MKKVKQGRAIPPTVRESNQAWVPASPVQCQKAETAVMAIQPPGATWRHYNPERGERVVRKAVLARCEAGRIETGRASPPHSSPT